MRLPGPPVQWPQHAVTILILGGADYFRGRLSSTDYIAGARSRVPPGNTSTAILYIREMEHMPQSGILQIILQPLLLAAIYWKVSGRTPASELQAIRKDLEANKWSGVLSYPEGGTWRQEDFGSSSPGKSTPAENVTAAAQGQGSIQKQYSQALYAPEQAQALADQELTRVAKLERQVTEKEEELLVLQAQLTESRERARRLQEAALAQDTPNKSTGSMKEAQQQSGGFQIGQRLQYFSVTQNIWMECEVIAVRPRDGAVQINVKPDYWLAGEEKAAKLRMNGVVGAAAGVACMELRGGSSPITQPYTRAQTIVR